MLLVSETTGSKVGLRQQPTCRPYLLGRLAHVLALIESVGPVLGNRLQDSGQLCLHDAIAKRRYLAIRQEHGRGPCGGYFFALRRKRVRSQRDRPSPRPNRPPSVP